MAQTTKGRLQSYGLWGESFRVQKTPNLIRTLHSQALRQKHPRALNSTVKDNQNGPIEFDDAIRWSAPQASCCDHHDDDSSATAVATALGEHYRARAPAPAPSPTATTATTATNTDCIATTTTTGNSGTASGPGFF